VANPLDQTKDTDPIETKEWLDALNSVIEFEGAERAHYLLEAMFDQARRSGVNSPFSPNTAYLNTIPTHLEAKNPGDAEMETRIRAYVRWNAAMMVLRAGKKDLELGGHIASFASAATLYDVGFNHFFHTAAETHGGDLIYVQGHSAPGVYARAYLLDRLSTEQMDMFRQEVDGKGLSSYPHPWLMPDFWQLPTVSMGLGPLMGIYQARFLKYLDDRGMANTKGRKVWVFCGDGEMDEPESLGAIAMAAREKLDNLIFVINCNLQRLDGPVRGNSKIIQELEGDFRGSGWNVIKLLWGGYWDELLARDKDGWLKRRMAEAVDGEYQNFKAKDGAYVREHFFGKYPELKAMVAHMSDDDIWRLNRGGHDPHKIYAAYHSATNHQGQPTVILAKTVKGFGMGHAGEGLNIAHQAKKMDLVAIKGLRDRFGVPVKDEDLEKLPYYKPAADTPEMKYMHERRAALGGYYPQRRQKSSVTLEVPPLAAFQAQLDSSGEREFSTTMAVVRILNTLVKDKGIGKHVVPIVPDESRTFGMEGMFRQLGIWSSVGQLYEPVDADQLMWYKESKTGQILQEGINEPGAMSSWIAAATSYSTNNVPMLPFYIYYSMFGIQRVGDLCWAAGDMRARGFLVGGTAGRTTLNGEGLQHEDGHSHIWFASIPNCKTYDPTFQYELAVIVQHGMQRMLAEQRDEFYYLTVMNENYLHPAMPQGAEAGIIKGMYLFRAGGDSKGKRVQLLGSGTIFNEVVAAAELLKQDWGVEADLWSCPSFNELRRDGIDAERWNLMHPTDEPRQSHVEICLSGHAGPVVAATDYMRTYADGIRPYVTAAGRRYKVLGTDGFGRSDSRDNLRRFFEVNRHYVVVAALKALAEDREIPASVVADAIAKYGLDVNKPNPATV
jgi:pyruvate dehydrogenase E1 component